MKELKQALAKRCAENNDSAQYIFGIEFAQDLFNRPVDLKTVQKGDVIYIKCLSIDMEAADKVTPHPQYQDRFCTTQSGRHYLMSPEVHRITVDDIGFYNDDFLLEAQHGVAFSTIKFQEEYRQALKTQREKEDTELVQNALSEIDRIRKPNLTTLARTLFVGDVLKTDYAKEFLNELGKDISKYIQQNNIQPPYTRDIMEQFKSVANDLKTEIRQNGLRSTRHSMAKILGILNQPLIYCENMEVSWQDVSYGRRDFQTPQKLPDGTYAFRGGFAPMVNADKGTQNQTLENVKVKSVIETKTGNYLYLTDIGIITSINLVQEYRDALSDAKLEKELDRGTDMHRYMSLNHKKNGLLSEIGVTVDGKYDIASDAQAFAEAALERGCHVIQVEKDCTRFIVGYESNEFCGRDIFPLKIPCDSAIPGTDVTVVLSEEGYRPECSDYYRRDAHIEEIHINPETNDFILVDTNGIVYTTYDEIVAAVQSLEPEVKEVDIDVHAGR